MVDGSTTLGVVEEKLKELEEEKMVLEKEIKKLDDQISRLNRNIIDYEKMKKNLSLLHLYYMGVKVK